MISDPIADSLIRIKNGYMAKKKIVSIPFSHFNNALLQLIAKEKFVESCEIDESKRNLKVTLRYEDDAPAITGLDRVSKPGLRVYKKKHKLPRVLGGLGIAIISTPKGLMTGKEARKKGLGGEVICKIW